MENSGLHWRGYFPLGAELTAGVPDQKEGYYFGSELPLDHKLVKAKTPMHGPNQWANEKMKRVVGEYCNAMSQLAESLLKFIAEGIGLPSNYFADRYKNLPTELFRIFCYPPATGDWGVREHTDMGFITILLQDHLGGLQAKTPNGWVEAPPVENTFVVNIGDMLELWSHGVLKATLHRVRNSAAENRYSFPFFFDPSWHSSLERIPREMLDGKLIASSKSEAESRWDALDLHKLDKKTTYGEFVWNKVSKVFPQLVEN